MKLFIYISILLLSVITTANAQFVKNDNLSKVEFYMQKNELDSAQKYIDKASLEEKYLTHTKVWFYKAFIYKEQYKTKEKQVLASKLRDESAAAIQQLHKIDTNKEYQPQLEALIKYLSSTYYNDAARALSIPDIALAKVNFNYYKTLALLSNPDPKSIQENEIQFKFAQATAIGSNDENANLSPEQKSELITIFSEILAIDNNNPSANYNLSLLYYNEGADMVNNMDYDLDFDKLLEVQDKIAHLFSKALPYMLKAYSANYRKEDTLEGLKNIYHGLNNEEKSVYYKKELDTLKK